MRWMAALLAATALFVPTATAHGALELNEFDTYAISDFEGQEDSFPYEGFEIWDIYVGDGYLAMNNSHAVYFKGNFAGDGTLRPTGGSVWSLHFTFDVGATSYERSIDHDGTNVVSNFEQLDWQIADGNVLQIHAWVPVSAWENQSVENLVVRSSVDGELRDIAPGGIYDPATGQEVPIAAPPTPIFPALGEGRIVDVVPLTGAAKFLDVRATLADDGATFAVNNTLAHQGQHFMLQLPNLGNWAAKGAPYTESLDGATGTTVALTLTPPAQGPVEPLQLDFATDIGGLQSWYAYLHEGELRLVSDESLARSYVIEAPAEDASALPLAGAVLLLIFIARRRK